MKKLFFLSAILMLSGCASTSRVDALEASLIAHTIAIGAVAEYIAGSQETGYLPSVEVLKAKLEAKDKPIKEDE